MKHTVVNMVLSLSLVASVIGFSSPLTHAADSQSISTNCVPTGKLEINYINVGQGGSTLIIGQDGTKILFDFGAVPGNSNIVPYLRDTVGLKPAAGIQYAMVSHRDKDHYVGYKDVVAAGYDVLIANYNSGSTKTTKMMKDNWLEPAKKTKAGAVKTIPLGIHIPLGECAEAIVMAANGVVYGEKKSGPKKLDENDRSISLFIRHGKFRYIIDGDLGSGPEKCTKHDTGQQDVQTRVAKALLDQKLMDKEHGVDVMHIAHHGSESSTSAAYYNIMKPEVGLISVGQHNSTYMHPRADVVDKVLMGDKRASCVTAPPLKALFQTEDGEKGCLKTGCTSFSGLAIGDIKLVTDGETGYTITGDDRVHGGAQEADQSPDKTWSFKLDED
jgi:competence protein ComEC